MEGQEIRKTKAEIAVEFLEVAIHSILYFRNVYPKAVFCVRKKFGTPVYISRNPDINEYINESLKATKLLLEENGVHRICVVIINEDEEVLEKFCFDVEEEDSLAGEEDHYFVRMEETFRDYLLKLSVIGDLSVDPSADTSFRIEITTNEENSVRLNENPDQCHFPFVEAETTENKSNQLKMFPIKTLNTSLLKLNMYIEKKIRFFLFWEYTIDVTEEFKNVIDTICLSTKRKHRYLTDDEMLFIIGIILLAISIQDNLCGGIKFSAETLSEISHLAKEGKTHLERLSENAATPTYGQCWKNSISDLQTGCKFLTDTIQSSLALKFTDCFLQMSGYEPLTCDFSKNKCSENLSDRAFNAYTIFYTHTQSICYFLQNHIWQEEAEKTIDKLSSTSVHVSEKLEEAQRSQDELLRHQKESLILQHNLNRNSRDVATILKLSEHKINLIMQDFHKSTLEQKQMLIDLVEQLISFKSWAVDEMFWLSSTIFYVAAIITGVLFTSVERTKGARIYVFVIFSLNYLCERFLSSVAIKDIIFLNRLISSSIAFSSIIWMCRKSSILLSLLTIIYMWFSYYDQNAINYQLLLEIRNQNLKILENFTSKYFNPNSSSKNQLYRDSIYSTRLNHDESQNIRSNNLNLLNSREANHSLSKCMSEMQKSKNILSSSPNCSFFLQDEIDNINNNKSEQVVSEKDQLDSSNKKKSKYNLRNTKHKYDYYK